MKKIISIILCISMLLAVGMFVGCDKSGGENDPNATPGAEANKSAVPAAQLPDTVEMTMMIKNYGTIKLELYPKFAPQTVTNFIYLVQSGYYDGVVFDHIDKGVIAQAGSYTVGYESKTTEFEYSIKGEYTENDFENAFMFGKGTIAMAIDRDGVNPTDSSSTDFFICLADETAAGFDGKYAAFGSVIEGMEVFDEIQKVTCNDNRPTEPIEILRIVIETDVSMFGEPEFIRAG